jgi:transposase InsO family protein
LVRRIERLRRRRYTGLRIAEELELAVSTVSLWLRRLGLQRLSAMEPKPEVVRYEKQRPGELLHLDTKKFAKIKKIGHRITGDRRGNKHGLGWEFLHVCIDDATRVAYAEVLPDEKGLTATEFVQRAIAWFQSHDVHVKGVMTDNGSCYRSNRFRRTLAERGIRHLYTQPYRPQTNGKAERFIRTTKHEWAYARAFRTSAARRLPEPLQPPTPPQGHRKRHTLQPSRGSRVNNVLVTYS